MENKYSKQYVDRLDVSVSTIDILKNYKITLLGDLNKYTQKDLKKMKIESEEIEKIKEELELLGLSLKCHN